MNISRGLRVPRLSGLRLSGLLGLAAVCALIFSTPAARGQGLALDTVERATGLARPVAIAHPADGSGRQFIVQQTGEILIWDGAQVLATPFLDLSSVVTCCGERGLLGLAFHPDYATNGEFFVNYTRTVEGQLETVVARYSVSVADPDLADAASAEILLTFDQPAGNHNGGQLAFGPDGYLYVSTGDGGGAGDPIESGQALNTLLGKVLRIDIDATDPGLPYAIPPDNPFVGVAGARGEIWAYGLRNPWRFSFDRQTGDLWIADVGQFTWEEVNRQLAGSTGGENYGWDCREGAHLFSDTNGDGNTTCPAGGFTEPVLEYRQTNGRCSVTGGFRYRGDDEPRLRGVYLYADFCTGEVFGTVPRCDAVLESRVLLDAPFLISAFGEDEAGEVYVTEFEGSGSASAIQLLALAAGSGGPSLDVTPSTLDFGAVEVGDTERRVVTLTNTNPGPEAVTVASTLLTGAGPLVVDRGLGPGRCGSFRPCLPPGASCTLGVTLQGTSAETLSEDWTLDGNFLLTGVDVEAEIIPCATSVTLTLTDETIDDTRLHRACDTLTAGAGVVVTSTGVATFCAGTRVVLGDGFRVELGGRLTLGVDCPAP